MDPIQWHERGVGCGPLNKKWVGGDFKMKNGKRKVLRVGFETRERKEIERIQYIIILLWKDWGNNFKEKKHKIILVCLYHFKNYPILIAPTAATKAFLHLLRSVRCIQQYKVLYWITSEYKPFNAWITNS